MAKKYSYSILGGTFDHFHKGHRHFIDAVCVQSSKLVIGLTTEVMHLGKEFRESIESYEVRKRSVEEFIKTNHTDVAFEIIELKEIYGTTLEDQNIEAIFVTEHGLANAEIINKKRVEKVWNKLKVEQVGLIMGEDEETISSTRIRSGEIDREGNSYLMQFIDSYKSNEKVTPRLKEAWGEILTSDSEILKTLKDKKYVFSVGDVTCLKLRDLDIGSILSIVDGKSERKEIPGFKNRPAQIENPQGCISSDAAGIVYDVLKSSITEEVSTELVVGGEEDLLALPLMLFAPLLSIVCYGLKDQGMVAVTVDEKIKSELMELIQKFDKEE